MTNIQLYTQISSLPDNLKKKVFDFIKSLLKDSKPKTGARVPGKAKGLVIMKDNFDDPIEGFEDYSK